jgi:ribosomal protein S20
MANLSSSKKMVRKIATRTARNKSHVTNMRTYIKKLKKQLHLVMQMKQNQP